MRTLRLTAVILALLTSTIAGQGQQITAGGQPAELQIRAAGERAVRITLKPISFKEDFPATPAVVDRKYAAPAISVREVTRPVQRTIGALAVEVRANPLTVLVKDAAGRLVQQVTFENDGTASFTLDDQPVLGLGEGGPRPEAGTPWRQQPVQFDRRGKLDTMEPRWQSDMYGSRNPVAMLFGTAGWGLFVASPWVQVDLRDAKRGVFQPWQPPAADAGPQTQRNQQQNSVKGRPPVDQIVPGLFDLFVFDARDPLKALKDFSAITGPAAMPPKWALGYMQSHRTLEDETQILGIVDTFRSKQIPIDAVIYLGTGFSPRGWNRTQPSFEFNPDVFKREPKTVLAEMHAKNVKVVVHMVPWDRDKLPTLHGTIPTEAGRNARRVAHSDLLAAASRSRQRRHRRVLAGRRRLVQSLRTHQAASALLPGQPLDDAERAPVEPAAERLSGDRAVGRMGVVGRHRDVVEDARGADRGRRQLLAEHRAVLGLGHRRVLSEQRVHGRALRAVASVRRVLRVVPIARPHVVDAPAVGLGPERHGPARERQPQHAAAARRPPQHPRSPR